jgi:Spy/CpxP family protein refolding chaperone
MCRMVLTGVFLLALMSAAAAQHVHPAPAPAAAATATSSLTAEEVRQLLDGDGMGLARAAELNGYPGPKHALERAAPLGLTDDQRAKITAIRERMLSVARRLGAAIVDQERALDEAFRSRSINSDDLAGRVQHIGSLKAELRAAHLTAHLESVTVLTVDQVRKYYELGAHGGHGK